MIIPLTPIRDAWGGVEPAVAAAYEPQKPTTPIMSSQQTSPPVVGYSPSTAFDTYKIAEDYVPNAMDVTVYDRDVIRSLMPMTSNKRSDLVTELLGVFFGDSTNINNRQDPSNDRVEYFRGVAMKNNKDVDSVHLVIMVLLAYILIDKLTTIWART
jgi:hypothetical protein